MDQAADDHTTGSLPSTIDTEEALYRLGQIRRGLTAFAYMLDDFDLDQRVEVGSGDVAAVIHVFGYALDCTCSHLVLIEARQSPKA